MAAAGFGESARNRLVVAIEIEEPHVETLLAEQPVVDLLCEPIWDLADRWRSA